VDVVGLELDLQPLRGEVANIDGESSRVVVNEVVELLIEEVRRDLGNTENLLHAIALAATFDPALVEEVFTVAARQMRARGVEQVLAPVLDVARDARWGRIEETYGEDPFLVSRLGAAAIVGLQGRRNSADAPIDGVHVMATAKHLTGHGQPEGGRNTAPAVVAPRTLREIFLPPFETAVRAARVESVMASYNEELSASSVERSQRSTRCRDEYDQYGRHRAGRLPRPTRWQTIACCHSHDTAETIARAASLIDSLDPACHRAQSSLIDNQETTWQHDRSSSTSPARSSDNTKRARTRINRKMLAATTTCTKFRSTASWSAARMTLARTSPVNTGRPGSCLTTTTPSGRAPTIRP
jgi:hypothetical protein